MIPAVWLFLTWFIATLISVWAIIYVAVNYEPWARAPDNGWKVAARDIRTTAGSLRHAGHMVLRSGGSVTGVGSWPVYIMIGFLLGIAHTLWLYS